MNTVDQFLWVDFYQEFAKKLVDYKDNRAELIKKLKEIYNLTEFSMPTLEKENNLVDIDPFTVFGLFNKKLTNRNRIKILEIVAKLFDLKSKAIAIQLKRGLEKKYIPKTEEISTLRGKIEIGESLRFQSSFRKRIVCSYEEFSVDNIMNRIIKSTMYLLLKSDIPKKRKKELRKLLLFSMKLK